jgi:hypothetical protein
MMLYPYSLRRQVLINTSRRLIRRHPFCSFDAQFPCAYAYLRRMFKAFEFSTRKAHMSRLLARRPDGIFIISFEQGEIGPDLFRAACNMGLEGLVSKRRDRPYRGGRSKEYIKMKNRSHLRLSA